jgi:4-aminobutyrate aminotransferase
MTKKYDGFIMRDKSEKSQKMMQRDKQSLSPSYTRSYGFVIDYGKGADVWDVDGHQYLDFAAGIAVLATGHCHPKIVETIKMQAEKYLHIGATDFFCPSQVELAEKLQQIVPIDKAEPADIMTYFANSGAEAVESALKLARYQDPKRNYVIAFYGAFHGRTMGALSVTASKYVQRAGYPFIPGGVEHVPYPAKSRYSEDDAMGDAVKFIEDFVIKNKIPANEIAAVIVEPIQGEGGYLLPRDDFFPKLRQFCDKHGILMTADEIQSGMGRTGKWYAIEHWDVKPDIICTAKGLGSGFPIGAIVTRREIMEKWIPGAHASTFGGNPMACAVAGTTIDIIEEEGILEQVAKLGEYTLERLTKFMADHPSIKRVEGKGLMIGMEFAGPNGDPIPDFRNKIADQNFLDGLLTLACGTSAMRIAPPLIITEEQMKHGLDIMEHSIAMLEEELWDTLG